uniref:Putative secreted protein n=1 Tax=Anopheles darlingi TaxID=43151 RepID=A0A2M4D940_ANODA
MRLTLSVCVCAESPLNALPGSSSTVSSGSSSSSHQCAVKLSSGQKSNYVIAAPRTALRRHHRTTSSGIGHRTCRCVDPLGTDASSMPLHSISLQNASAEAEREEQTAVPGCLGFRN